MQFLIYVQDVLYKTVTTDDGYNLAEIFREVNQDIDQGILTVDSSKDLKIEVRPIAS
jgi:hypothetical protein